MILQDFMREHFNVTKHKRFRDVRIGEEFRFLSESTMPHSGMKRGPWRKISARKYKHTQDGMECHVGSINVEVCK